MDKKTSNFKRISAIYNRYGLKGLVNTAAKRCGYIGLPLVYRTRLLQGMYHPRLQTAYLELTNKCNLRCKMCKWQSRDRTGFISRQLFESCVNQFSEIGLDVLNMQFGGESLLHPDFENFLKFAISRRDGGKIGSIGMTDNGMLFNQNIADLFVSLNVDWINFSLDGIGEVNDKIRLGSKYSIIEKNIKYLLEKRGSSKKPVILLNMVDYGKSEEQKMDFFREWVPLVDSVELLPSILPNNKWESQESLPSHLKIAPPPPYCSIPFNTIIIGWDGKVTGCCFDSKIEMILGDVNNQTVKQIWNGSKFQELRKAVILNSFSKDSPCFGCDFWKINFEHWSEIILNGQAKIEYGGGIRKIHRINQN
jgi:radical SAM protein with 4Fe4S-binding SPASM domain